MLSRSVRLRQTRDINRVYARGRYGGAGGLHIKALKNNLEHARATIVVGKKVSKKAVIRNRIRRQIAGYLEANWQTIEPGYDIVVSVHEDISKISSVDLGKQLTSALVKCGAHKA